MDIECHKKDFGDLEDEHKKEIGGIDKEHSVEMLAL